MKFKKINAFLLLLLFLNINPASAQETEKIKTPPDVVKSLLQTIEKKNWESACQYLSADFLAKHKQDVLAGEYFKRSGNKDSTVFYTSKSGVASNWRKQEKGKVATVTLNLGGPPNKYSMGICEITLVKEDGDWKVDKF